MVTLNPQSPDTLIREEREQDPGINPQRSRRHHLTSCRHSSN